MFLQYRLRTRKSIKKNRLMYAISKPTGKFRIKELNFLNVNVHEYINFLIKQKFLFNFYLLL